MTNPYYDNDEPTNVLKQIAKALVKLDEDGVLDVFKRSITATKDDEGGYTMVLAKRITVGFHPSADFVLVHHGSRGGLTTRGDIERYSPILDQIMAEVEVKS